VRADRGPFIGFEPRCDDDVKDAVELAAEILIAARLRTEPIAARLDVDLPTQVRKRGVK
jgi:hypothetical protein